MGIVAVATCASRSYLRQQVVLLVGSKPKDPRSGERSYQLVRSKPKDPRSGERSYQLVRSKPKDPRSGERSYPWFEALGSTL